ncbi:enoyl-CoA hydratase [Gordonia liuliyuniae]|uniref:Enoyl-CoA hydratase n=1 Tax=Gordonia liuliyuniae TaxID=2911517 RepID=A0ABS9IVP5_9ACTN|nr:enoyl-CoA hydratase [Gordonia liuliyuniae]MCF8589635.1 enoyl-CoA hydratase [Gordonia liuliyuniae]
MTADDVTLVQERHGRVLVLRLNRPDARNSLTSGLIGEIQRAQVAAGKDDGVDAVILTGTDPAFCAGLDLAELGGTGENLMAVPDPDIPPGHRWKPLSKPVIGAINGAAVTGGLELALGCDFLIASEKARFADTHARFGLAPSWGMTARLPALVGRAFALRMSLSGDFVDAQTALRVGLVTEVVAHDTLLDRALDVASTIAGNDRSGVRTLLASYRRAERHLLDPALVVEQETSDEWKKTFDPSVVADRRSSVIDRGRDQVRR